MLPNLSNLVSQWRTRISNSKYIMTQMSGKLYCLPQHVEKDERPAKIGAQYISQGLLYLHDGAIRCMDKQNFTIAKKVGQGHISLINFNIFNL